ncbi:peroxiredoxin-5, mitochondrial isoform X2 [Crotalus tigris]|uniref:peroxiredoxin-5, mitochondrial isoform X2 n=1 Tax=Crotalus tigris TaxID=88082 RepID=UPI00192F35CC|nr:peroxiredoxin-5, mitochondrial isoform X2 [Crotalus tigris]
MAAVTPGISMATGWNRAGALGRACWGAGPSSLLANCGATRRAFASGAAAMAALKIGDKLPNVEVYEGDPSNKVNLSSLFKGKKGILFGVPGAFTPGCSQTHLPGYVEKAGQLKGKGVEIIACLSVNDIFVMNEWGKAHQAEGKVLHGGGGQHGEVPQRGRGRDGTDLQPGQQHRLPALRPRHPPYC